MRGSSQSRRANLLARRFSHFLECGIRGWLLDCKLKPSDWYFQYYYHKSFAEQCDADGFISSWGGSVLRGDDGTYHMWAAEMVNHCGIVVWIGRKRRRTA